MLINKINFFLLFEFSSMQPSFVASILNIDLDDFDDFNDFDDVDDFDDFDNFDDIDGFDP